MGPIRFVLDDFELHFRTVKHAFPTCPQKDYPLSALVMINGRCATLLTLTHFLCT